MTTKSFIKSIKLKTNYIPNLIKAIESTKKQNIDKNLKYKNLSQDEVNKMFKKDGIRNDNSNNYI